MKTQTTESDSERDADLALDGNGSVAGDVPEETRSPASSVDLINAAEVADAATDPDDALLSVLNAEPSTADTLVVGATSISTAPAPKDVARRPNLLTRITSAIPNIGLDDRAGRVILSILLAVLLWFYVVSLENPSQTTVFNDLAVDVRGLGTGLKLVNPIAPVDVTVQAPQSVLGFLRPADVRPFVDLTGLPAGVHTIPLRADVRNTQGGSLTISVSPGTVQLQLEVESTREFPVQVQITGTPAFGYGFDNPQADPTSVRVTGAEDLIARISKVVTSVNIDERAATLQGARQPVALDEAGNEIAGLTFEPPQVQVVVPIRLGVSYKVVGVRADTRGQPAPGYRVSAITTDPNTVTICCSPNVLSDTQFLDTMPVSISGTTFNVITQTQLVLPPDVELYPGQTRTISVTVSVEPLVTTLQVSVAPIVEGQPEGAAVVVSPDRLDITLAGTFDQLQGLKPTDVRAFLSLTGRGPGTHEIRPQVVVPQGVKLERSSPDTVTVTIIAPTPLPTQTPTVLPTTTAEPSATLQPTVLTGATVSPTPSPEAATPTPPDASTPTIIEPSATTQPSPSP